MRSLADSVVIVTGASRGLGRSMALRFAQEDARVVLVARSQDDLETVARSASSETLIAPADVTDTAAIESVVEATLDAFGTVDVLINNAAIAQTHLSGELRRTSDVPPEEWETVLSVNLSGPFYFAQEVLPPMVEGGGGNIINISSNAANHPFPNCTPYVVSKHGLAGLTKQLAIEYREDGINANGLYPDGPVATTFQTEDPDITDEQLTEMASPDVMNDASVLLAKQGPDGITGETLPWHVWETKLDLDG